MNKGELTKFLEPFTDEIEIILFSFPHDFELFPTYNCCKEGTGRVVLILGTGELSRR